MSAFVGLHAFKGFEGVVKDASCGIEGEVLVGSYSRSKPALRGCPFYRKHVVWEKHLSAGTDISGDMIC